MRSIRKAENLDNKSGNFAGVPNEMIEKLMNMDLTPHENRLVWFFIRNLQGYQMIERLISTSQIVESTRLPSTRVCDALASLVKKGVIQRRSGWKRGEYIYRWNESLFKRTHATKQIYNDPKVIHMEDYKQESIPENRNSNSENSEQLFLESGTVVPKIRNSTARSKATRAALRPPKYRLKDINILKKGKVSIETAENLELIGDEYSPPSKEFLEVKARISRQSSQP